MACDPNIGGPCKEDRQLIYERMKLSDMEQAHVETMIHESAQRPVATAALTNVRVLHNSLKNGKSIWVESHTCELVHAFELELDPDVIGYYAQVPCRGIKRIISGRGHVSPATIDFLVFRAGRIELVECKTQDWLEKNGNEPDWIRNGNSWTHLPYEEWAAKRGLGFSVWVPPEPPGTYRQNLEACFNVLSSDLREHERLAMDRASAKIAKQPATIEEMTDSVPGFNERLALLMLAKGIAFGPWCSIPVLLTDRFTLYAFRDQAIEADAHHLQAVKGACVQLQISDPLLLASKTDFEKGRKRLAEVRLMESGQLPATRLLRRLAKKIKTAEAEGRPALSACITRYASCGNRSPRLTPEQEQAIETVITRDWNTGRVRRPLDLVHMMERECEQLGVEPCGRYRLDVRRRMESPTRRALLTGGFRAYHAVRPSTDPRTRSLPPVGYCQVLHIDSSDLDIRCAPDLATGFPAAKAKFYIGLDGATGYPMAHALIFGSARTDGLAILMREYVKRNHHLPNTIHVDRGPENTSRWLKEFCEGRISLRHSPTAASAWNGIAENTIKQVNEQVAHQLAGSTLPDQRGRKVDGRFKSSKNARTQFVDIWEHFSAFVYGDLPRTPQNDGMSPEQRRDEVVARLGYLGTRCDWSDDFQIQTSIRSLKCGRPNAQRGIRTELGWFVSDELLAALRTGVLEEIRSDCCYPEVLYARISGQWIKAFHSRIQSAGLLSDEERLYELLLAPIRRADARARKTEIRRQRLDRYQLALASRATTHHPLSEVHSLALEPPQEAPSEAPQEMENEYLPFEEREDY